MHIIEDCKRKYLILCENVDRLSGRGFYVFEQLNSDHNPSTVICMQMPHSFKDTGTRDIGRLILLDAQKSYCGVLAWAWNTVPRYTQDQNLKILDNRSDFAHAQRSYFTALTDAFLKVFNNKKAISAIPSTIRCVFVQLHGFTNDKRKTLQGKEADIIISSGLKRYPKWLPILRDQLRSFEHNLKIYAFPIDIEELGAINNRIGNIVNDFDAGKENYRFIHVELSDSTRKNLKEEKMLRYMLLKSISSMSHSSKK
jgi:hypothetical protein